MNCERVRSLLGAYVDGELDLVTALEIEEHLQGCESCRREYRLLKALHEATRAPSLQYSAQPRLESRIRASLKESSPRAPAFPAFSWRSLASASAAVLVLFAIVAILARGLTLTSPQALLAQEVQAAHVRSLMADHLTDVTSTDQHTVKPWFDGKLDFSPPVIDLAAQGFPLIGGRLDFLNGQPAAALVYQRARHDINVFIWPSQDTGQGTQTSSLNGYNLYQWNQAGMTFWAVSDLNASELGTFVGDLQKNIP